MREYVFSFFCFGLLLGLGIKPKPVFSHAHLLVLFLLPSYSLPGTLKFTLFLAALFLSKAVPKK